VEEVLPLSEVLFWSLELEPPLFLELLPVAEVVETPRVETRKKPLRAPPTLLQPLRLLSLDFRLVEAEEASDSPSVEVLEMSVETLVPVRLTVLPSPLDSVPHRDPVFSELLEVMEEVPRSEMEVASAAPVVTRLTLRSESLTSTVLEEVLLLEEVELTLASTHLRRLSSEPLLPLLDLKNIK
jgi:hypothetical protein